MVFRPDRSVSWPKVSFLSVVVVISFAFEVLRLSKAFVLRRRKPKTSRKDSSSIPATFFLFVKANSLLVRSSIHLQNLPITRVLNPRSNCNTICDQNHCNYHLVKRSLQWDKWGCCSEHLTIVKRMKKCSSKNLKFIKLIVPCRLQNRPRREWR